MSIVDGSNYERDCNYLFTIEREKRDRNDQFWTIPDDGTIKPSLS
ncbi:MAG: hypothetical protein VKJ02_19590 [Snowella sp.]|nr:hypothetical protein [Snowella sp.]